MNQKTETAIAEYSPTAAALADLASRMANVVYDVSTPAGMEAAKKDRAEVKALRVALEHKRKEIKEPALKRCSEIDTEAARIKAELEKYEGPPDRAIKAEEQRIEDARLAKVAAEETRQRLIQARIQALRGVVNDALRMKVSADVAHALSAINNIEITDELFAEFKETASIVKTETVAELERIRDEFVARELEAERLRKDREDLERMRAEQEARDKVERDRLAAEARVESERIAKERADFEAEQSAARAKVAAENARVAAEQAAAQKVIDDARRELEALQQAERDAKAAREREAREAAELAEREAEEQRRLNYRPTFLEIVAVLCDHYDRDEETVNTWIAPVERKREAA